MMQSGEDKSNVVQLPEGVTPFVRSTQKEFLGQKYMVKEVPLDDSGDEEYFPVIYGTGGGNEHTKKSNYGADSTDQKKSQHISQGKCESSIHKKEGDFPKMFTSKGIRNEATSKLNSVYEEIHPVIEMHGPDNQNSVPISVVEKWIEANCSKYKADFDLYFSMIKNVMCSLPATEATAAGPSEGGTESQIANAEEGTRPQTTNAEEGDVPQTTNAEGGAE